MRLMALEANSARFVERARPVAGRRRDFDAKLRGSQLIQQWEALMVDALRQAALPYDARALMGDDFELAVPELAPTAYACSACNRGATRLPAVRRENPAQRWPSRFSDFDRRP